MDAFNKRIIGSSNSDHNVVESLEVNHEVMHPPSLPTPAHPGARPEEDSAEEPEFSTAMLKYIGEILMEDDLEEKNCMFQDCVTLLAAEKSFYDALGDPSPPPPPPPSPPSNPLVTHAHFQSAAGDATASNVEASQEASPVVNHMLQPNSQSKKDDRRYFSSNTSRGRKHQHPNDGDDYEERSTKHSLLCSEVCNEEPSDIFDRVLLSYNGLGDFDDEAREKSEQNQQSKGFNSKTGRIKKKRYKGKVVDLRALLAQCAHAVASSNHRAANDLLNLIRLHSSPSGDGSQRLAHFFANGLEARLSGTGMEMHRALATKRTSAADIIKAFQLYGKASPFMRMSNLYANKIISKLAKGATKLHVIDFGILYGFQWPCLIQFLSVRPGGPPKLHITGIDFPQSGFRPAERVEETGRRLANYCKRFKVPFQYKAIAQRWETIRLEELEIDREEVLVVNSFYRMKNLPDETVTTKCPKDAVLRLIRRINPDVFIHGVLNGTFNSPFFLTRFREALFHFDSLFDMLEAAVAREDQGRTMFEKEVYGRDIMNIVACEGSERIERPDIYKRWQARNDRAELRLLPLEEEVLEQVRKIVKLEYHRDFVVEVDGGWMLMGWKGRVIYAVSCWKPSPSPFLKS